MLKEAVDRLLWCRFCLVKVALRVTNNRESTGTIQNKSVFVSLMTSEGPFTMYGISLDHTV